MKDTPAADHERREALGHVGPVNLGDLGHHEVANVDQSAAGGSAGDNGDDRREERGEDEQHTGGDGGEAGAAAVRGTRSGLDKGGDGRNAHKAASCSRHGVRQSEWADVLDIAVLGEELALLGYGHSGPMVSKKSLMSRENATMSSIGSVRTFTMARVPSAVAANGAAKSREIERCHDARRCLRDAQRNAGEHGDDDADEQRARGRCREASATVTTIETIPTMKAGEVTSPRPTRVPLPATMMPGVGQADEGDEETQANGDGMAQGYRMASMMASRRPHKTSSKMTMPSRKMTPMATCQSPPHMVAVMPATMALMPRPEAQASGRLAKMPMPDGHDAGAQTGGAGERARRRCRPPESIAGLTAMM